MCVLPCLLWHSLLIKLVWVERGWRRPGPWLVYLTFIKVAFGPPWFWFWSCSCTGGHYKSIYLWRGQELMALLAGSQKTVGDGRGWDAKCLQHHHHHHSSLAIPETFTNLLLLPCSFSLQKQTEGAESAALQDSHSRPPEWSHAFGRWHPGIGASSPPSRDVRGSRRASGSPQAAGDAPASSSPAAAASSPSLSAASLRG